MEKNIPKYNSYRSAMEQIDAAISGRFYLEAITIEESILTDRLLRFCRDHGYKDAVTRLTLGGELNFIRPKQDILTEAGFIFLAEIEQFWKARCTCLHQIVKSEPGEPTTDFEEFINLAEQTAINGKVLVKKVSGWAQKYKIKALNAK